MSEDAQLVKDILNSMNPDRILNDVFFNITSDTCGKGDKQISLMDVGDFCVLHFDKQFQPEKLRDVVFSLYESLGESPSFIPLNLSVTHKQQCFITKTCGRIFQKDSNMQRSGESESVSVALPMQLAGDIRAIVSYFDVATRHDKLREFLQSPDASPPGPFIHPSNFNSVPRSSPAMSEDILPGITPPTSYEELSDQTCIDAGVSSDKWQPLTAPHISTPSTVHILYNDLFHVALVFENVSEKSCVSEICHEFPEFNMIRKLRNLNDKRALCSDLFHCKAFDNVEDLNKKIDNFVSLYDLAQNDDESPPIKNIDKVRDALDTYYIISNDPGSRMKASDLIDGICRCISNGLDSTFKKRLPGYLIECGLRKKRLRDGNYYWGIRRKDVQDLEPIESMSIDSIVEKRRRDLETCKKDVQIQTMPIDNIFDKRCRQYDIGEKDNQPFKISE